MYAPPYARWEDREAALRLVADWNFGALVTVVGGETVATHLPFLVDAERNVLRAHLARANPHAAHLGGASHLAVFLGPHAYVSPDWYGDGRADVPTWNYLAVHVRGTGRVLTEPEDVDAFLADLSSHEEQRRSDLARGGRVWTLDKMAPADHARMRAAIVAFEIDIDAVEAKAKLSQNKPAAIAERVVAALLQSGSQAGESVARAMQRLRRP